MSNELAIMALELAMKHLILGTVLFGLAHAILRWRLIGPSGRANLLLLALILLVAAPVLSVARGDLQHQATTDASVAPPALVAAGATGPAPSARAEPGHWTLPPTLPKILLAIWVIGAGWQITRLLAGYWRLRKIVAEAGILPRSTVAAANLVPDHVEIRVTADFGPAVIGVLAPKILLPRALVDSASATDLKAVLAHEVSHVARGDAVGHALQRLAQALFWWSPVVHWMAARLEIEREVACDLRAASRFGDRGSYALAIVDLVEQLATMKARSWLPAVAMATSLRGLDERVDAVIFPEEQVSSAKRWCRTTMLIAATSVAVGAGSFALAQSPHLALEEGDTATNSHEAKAREAAQAREQTDLKREQRAMAEQVGRARDARSEAHHDETLASATHETALRAIALEQRQQVLEGEAEDLRQRREAENAERRQQQEWANEASRQREEWQAERARQETEWKNKQRRQQQHGALELAGLPEQQAAQP